jgi:hypothetical protein
MPVTATDDYASWQGNKSLDSPASAAVAITKSDTDQLAKVTRAIYVGGAGDAALVLGDDTAAVTFVALAAGQVYPLRVKQVKSTGTTATNLVALY